MRKIAYVRPLFQSSPKNLIKSCDVATDFFQGRWHKIKKWEELIQAYQRHGSFIAVAHYRPKELKNDVTENQHGRQPNGNEKKHGRG